MQHADFNNIPTKNCVQWCPGQDVVLLNWDGEEIGTGKVHKARGMWGACNLEEAKMCVVDINVIRTGINVTMTDGCTGLPIPVKMEGETRVLWASNKLFAA